MGMDSLRVLKSRNTMHSLTSRTMTTPETCADYQSKIWTSYIVWPKECEHLAITPIKSPKLLPQNLKHTIV